MVANIVAVIVVIGLVILFAWLTRRASRARLALVKWPGMLLAGLLTLVAAALTVILVIGLVKLNFSPYSYPASNVKVEMTSARVQRGAQIANICMDCHSSSGQLPLDGSKDDFLAGSPMPLGSMFVPNLTPGGPLKDWSDAEVLRSIREGVDKNGRPLLIMPSAFLHNMSDEDAQSLVAFLRSQPAVERATPERNLSPLVAVLVGVGLFPTSAQPPLTAPVVAPQQGTAQYGGYLAVGFGCTDCHGVDFKGTTGGFGPSGPSLAAIVPNWAQADLVRVFREGKDPSGRDLSEGMPWKVYNPAFSDADLADLYSFLHGLK